MNPFQRLRGGALVCGLFEGRVTNGAAERATARVTAGGGGPLDGGEVGTVQQTSERSCGSGRSGLYSLARAGSQATAAPAAMAPRTAKALPSPRPAQPIAVVRLATMPICAQTRRRLGE